MVNKGQTVSLVLSNGQPPSSVIMVPDFRNKSWPTPLWASAQNINLIIKEDSKSVFPYGVIAAQQPGADTEITPDSSLEVTVSRRKVEGEEKTYHLHYEMPQGKNASPPWLEGEEKPYSTCIFAARQNASRVRVVLITEAGELDVMNEMQQPGSKIDLEIPYAQAATVRVLVDGVLVREREIQ